MFLLNQNAEVKNIPHKLIVQKSISFKYITLIAEKNTQRLSNIEKTNMEMKPNTIKCYPIF